jgi:hypothetical protein
MHYPGGTEFALSSCRNVDPLGELETRDGMLHQ